MLRELTPEKVILRNKAGPNGSRNGSSIADRMSWLEGSQDSWRSRVSDTDAKKFTVEGKISNLGKKLETSEKFAHIIICLHCCAAHKNIHPNV